MKTIRTKKLSNNFYDDEIIARLPNGDLVLKPNVKRRYYMFEETEENASQVNTELIQLDKLKGFSDDNDDEEGY